MVWTDEQIGMLTTLWREGKSASEIATFIGCDISRNAIIGKAHRLGLAGRASPIKKKKEIKLASLSHLTERMCKWPFGDPKKPDFHFCGKAVDITKTYCPEHRALAYAPPRKPIEVAKNQS